jgi:hypothetical protein
MRVAAAMRSDDQRIKVAGDDFGGGTRQKDLLPVHKDDKSFVIGTYFGFVDLLLSDIASSDPFSVALPATLWAKLRPNHPSRSWP